MKPPRQSIAGAMVIVAFLALDFAVVRTGFRFNPERIIGAAVACLSLQVAVLALFRSRGRARAFWAGFLVLGSLCTTSYTRAMRLPQHMGMRQGAARVALSMPVLKPYPRLSPFGPGPVQMLDVSLQPDSRAYRYWMLYARRAGDRVAPFFFDLDDPPASYSPRVVVYRAIFWSVPQLLCAFVGGILAASLYELTRRARPGGKRTGAPGEDSPRAESSPATP